MEDTVPAGLTEEGAGQEAGGGEAAAARGHGRSGTGSGEGCGHPPMTLPGPRGTWRGPRREEETDGQSVRRYEFTSTEASSPNIGPRRERIKRLLNEEVDNSLAFPRKRGFSPTIITTGSSGDTPPTPVGAGHYGKCSSMATICGTFGGGG